MHIPVVLAVTGAATAVVPGAWSQRPLAKQAGDDRARDDATLDTFPFPIRELGGYIEDVMDRWHAPGMAVAIIKGKDTWTKASPTVPLMGSWEILSSVS